MNQNVGKSALKSHLRKFFGRICNAIFVTFLFLPLVVRLVC